MALWEWSVAIRYLSATRRRGFVSFVALMSSVGLMLGVAVLIVVLSVMNGFEGELRARILSVTSHASLMGLAEQLPNWQQAQRRALQQAGILSAVPYVETQSMLAHERHVSGSMVRGVLPEDELRTAGLAQHMRSGRIEALRAGSWRIVLGAALAAELQAKLGDSVVIVAPQGTATPNGIEPRMRRFVICGVFESGMYEFDRGLALVHLADARRLFRMGEGVTGLRLTLADPLQAPAVVRQLALDLGGGFIVSDWTRSHANFFRSIQITKSMMFIILSLIVAVAAFNLVATLVMIVKEKQSDIAILRTFGALPRSVLGVFSTQGALIGLIGTLAGAALGVLLALNLETLVHRLEQMLGTHFLDARVYFMSDLPAIVQWLDVVRVCGVAFGLCAVATLYPAWRAARVQPAQGLRHD